MYNKYGAKKTIIDNISFDSKLEAKVYSYLRDAQRASLIQSLVIKPVYKVYLDGQMYFKHTPDFEFVDSKGKLRVIDTKGVDTDASRLRRKGVEIQYGIKIEVIHTLASLLI